MKKIAYHNPKKHVVYVGGKAIQPNQTREIDEVDHPDYKRPDQAETPVEDALAALSAGKAADIAKAVPALSDADLIALQALEDERAESKQRKGVYEAIATEQLNRAGDEAATTFEEELAGKEDDELQVMLEAFSEDADAVAKIQAEIDSRA